MIDGHPLAGKRVAIVAGNFSPEIGYQEVDLANAFTRLGAHVRVLTSTRPSRNVRALVREDYPAGLTRADGYDIVRLVPRLTLGTNVLGCKTLPVVRDFAPDHVVLVGPGKLFGLDLFSSEAPSWRRIAIIQDNSDDGRGGGPIAKKLLRFAAHRAVKRPAYRRVVRNADRVVLNVPETREIISAWLGDTERRQLTATGLDLRLGFDPHEFFFDPDARHAWREKHGVSEDDLLLVTCTRAVPGKKLEDIVDTVSRLQQDGRPIRYALAGVLDDEYGRALLGHVGAQPDPSGFILFPVIRHHEMRELFSAGDLGYWPRTAITIQQAMGTGLPVVLRNAPNVNHLLTDGENGWYIQSGQTLEQVLGEAVAAVEALDSSERLARRQDIASSNSKYLSYDRIALDIVNGFPDTTKVDAK